MQDEPDVRVEGLDHLRIITWAHQGKAGESTTLLEHRLQSIIDALRYAADEVNKAVQQTHAGDWDGSAARTAASALEMLRDVDESLHADCTANRESAMGQSGESAATRARIPPIPLNLDGPSKILNSTLDPKNRISAQQAAEDRAREVLAEYQEDTRHRLVNLPPLAAVPSVVLDATTDDSAPSGTPHGRANTPVGIPSQSRPGTTTATTEPQATPSGQAVPVDRSAATSSTAAQTAAAGTSPSARSAPAPVMRATSETGVGGVAPVPVGEPELIEEPAPRPGNGPRSGAEQAVERQPVMRREAGAARTSGHGMSGVLGGAGGSGNKDEEHRNRYHLPSGEPFDTDDDEYLRDGEFYVAPDVIGGPE